MFPDYIGNMFLLERRVQPPCQKENSGRQCCCVISEVLLHPGCYQSQSQCHICTLLNLKYVKNGNMYFLGVLNLPNSLLCFLLQMVAIPDVLFDVI